jgi:hypothetical protein
MQGFSMLGSMYFHRMPFIKTILAAFALVIALAMLAALVGGSPEAVFTFWDTDNQLSAGNALVAALFWFGVPMLLWVAAFFALQERELHR